MLLALQLNNLLEDAADLVEVPDVVGQTQASATTELEGVLFVVAVETDYSDSVAVGLVISQSPTAGSDAAEGSTVTITVSLGARLRALNRSYRGYEAKLSPADRRRRR